MSLVDFTTHMKGISQVFSFRILHQAYDVIPHHDVNTTRTLHGWLLCVQSSSLSYSQKEYTAEAAA